MSLNSGLLEKTIRKIGFILIQKSSLKIFVFNSRTPCIIGQYWPHFTSNGRGLKIQTDRVHRARPKNQSEGASGMSRHLRRGGSKSRGQAVWRGEGWGVDIKLAGRGGKLALQKAGLTRVVFTRDHDVASPTKGRNYTSR